MTTSRGSSPLARGLRHGEGCRQVRPRIIPARAGFTSYRSPRGPAHADHPRSRGVYASWSWRCWDWRGSSPLARGLRPPQGRRIHRQWIIPARAGFTEGGATPSTCSRDHPRSRGVYGRQNDVFYAIDRSSPLARGLPSHTSAGTSRDAIIPARAGFTTPPTTWEEAVADHPRSRGVYPKTMWALDSTFRSSPLARGLRSLRWETTMYRTIIPARAGFTGRGGRAGAAGADHPRSRGVYSRVWLPKETAARSSPLARGLQ